MNALATNGDTPLHVAMRLPDENQCLVIAKLLVEAGCNPCELDANDKPPIHAAVVRGFVSVVEYLLSLHVPLPSRILFAAFQTIVVKRVEMIRLLVGKGANVHVFNPDGDALLHITMRSLDRSVSWGVAEILLDVGCNPLARNLLGETPLHIAAKQGYHEIVNYLMLFSSSLLQDDSAVQPQTFRPRIDNTYGLCFSPGDEARVRKVIQQFLDGPEKYLEWAKVFVHAAGDHLVRGSGGAALVDIAERRGFGEVVEYLASQAVPLPSAILFTALRHQLSMIPSLVSRGADVHALEDGDTLLHVAMSILGEAQCRTTTQILVEAGCNPCMLNAANKQPIHIAMSRGLSSVVEYLLSPAFNSETSATQILLGAGCDPSPPPELPSIALHCSDKYSMIRLLADYGADVSHLAPSGGPPLHTVLNSTVIENQCLRTTKLLCVAGWNSFAPDTNGITPLHIAITRVFTSVVTYLLSRDVPLPSDILFFALDLQPSKIRGDTHNWKSIISSLVHKGANVHAQDRNRNTLLHRVLSMDSAHDQVRLEVIKIFTEAGCSTSIRNIDGKLPIQIAVAHLIMPPVLEYLLSHNPAFPPAILLAVLEGQNASSREVLWMVTSFIAYGADVCAIAANGDSVLHVVLACGMRWRTDHPNYLSDIVDVLVRAGCNTHARDAMGRTPLELAVVRGYHDVAGYLQRTSAALQ